MKDPLLVGRNILKKLQLNGYNNDIIEAALQDINIEIFLRNIVNSRFGRSN